MAVYTFSLTSFIVGILILALGGMITLKYNKFAEYTGVSNFSTWRIIGLVTCGAGFIVMLNIHTYLLLMLVQLIVSGL
jgi:hypothetical protein